MDIKKGQNDMKRTTNFYLNSEADFVEKCLNLLNLNYTRDDNAKDSNGWTVINLTYYANDEQNKALIQMFKASANDLR